jgi:hypothetical protein
LPAPLRVRAVACDPKGALCGAFSGEDAGVIRRAIQSGAGATLLIRLAPKGAPLAVRIGHRVDARNGRAYARFETCMKAIGPNG